MSIPGTALEHLQQKWANQIKFIIIPKTSQNVEILSSIQIKLEKWKLIDWKIFAKSCLENFDQIDKENLAIIIAEFIIRNNLAFSPNYIRKLIMEFGHLHKIRKETICTKFTQIEKVCGSIDDAHGGYEKLKINCKETKKKLENAIEKLEEIKNETDISIQSYRQQFDETLESSGF